jgi:hypothetical protein
MSFPNHGSKDMATGTLKKILKQAGLKLKWPILIRFKTLIKDNKWKGGSDMKLTKVG